MLNRLEMLRIFCAAAEARNFKEAAQRLGVSPQAVTRAVKELESQVGELLFHRNTRQSHITTFGEALAAQAKSGIQGIDEIFRAGRAKQNQQEVEGVVRITAPEAVQWFLVPFLAQLNIQYPALRFDLRFSNQATNVIDEQIDVGIRIGFMRDSRYVARTVADAPFFIVGTPELIARVGVPASAQELADKPVTAAIDPNTGKPWPWFLAGDEQWHPRSPAVVTNDTRAELNAVLQGMGFGQIIGFHAIPYLRNGELVSVLDELSPAPWTVNIYRPQRGPVAARVRVVFDWLVEQFGNPEYFASCL
ncbi:MAG TPA: LysR family transcriptional regulator [Rhodocyclaceae bacterium]|nr:LysR family transcriptional regulator [Rhodocyclaceae bacterium]